MIGRRNERFRRSAHWTVSSSMRSRRKTAGGSLSLCSLQCLVFLFSLQVLSSNCQSDTTVTTLPIPIPIVFATRQPIQTATATPTATPTLPPLDEATTSPPSYSNVPSLVPTLSAMPTITPKPTDFPTNWPTHVPTMAPTIAPTISPFPSTSPSVAPSFAPSISPAPSALPTVSPAPTTSSAPSAPPSAMPSVSAAPSTLPSAPPSQSPSHAPSTSFPTQSPTPIVERNQTAVLSMVIHGLDRMIESRPLSLVTSLHVRNFWRGFGKERSPFYIKEVSTLLMEERALERRGRQETVVGYPSPRRLQFQITIAYRLRDLDTLGALEELQVLTGRNLNEDDFLEFIYDWRGMFTMPFEEDSLSYLQALDAELVNNTYWLRMDFEGVQEPGATQRRVISFSAATVFAAVLIAGAVYFVTKLRQKNALLSRRTGGDSPIVGAMVGGNPSENILISESYDDDFQFGRSQHTNPSSLLQMRNNSRTEDDIEPPPMEVTKDSKYGSPSAAISDVASSVGDIADRPKYASPSQQGTVFSASPSVSARNSQADAMSNTMEMADEEPPPAPDELSNAGSSTGPPPFVGDFQMEVQSLED